MPNLQYTNFLLFFLVSVCLVQFIILTIFKKQIRILGYFGIGSCALFILTFVITLIIQIVYYSDIIDININLFSFIGSTFASLQLAFLIIMFIFQLLMMYKLLIKNDCIKGLVITSIVFMVFTLIFTRISNITMVPIRSTFGIPENNNKLLYVYRYLFVLNFFITYILFFLGSLLRKKKKQITE